ESSDFRARLKEAAADPTNQPWQREFMLGLARGDRRMDTRSQTRAIHGAAIESFTGSLDGTWDKLSLCGRIGSSAIYDPVRDRMVVFGGQAQGNLYLNDVWALSLAGTPAWTALTPTGTPPSGRTGHTAIYDPVRDRMVVFGGAVGDNQFLNEVWA